MAGLVTAVDIGSEAVKVVTLRAGRRGVAVAGAGRTPLEPGEAGATPQAVGRALRHAIRTHNVPVGQVILGMGGRGAILRYVSLPIVPPEKLRLLVGFEVEEQLGSQASAASVIHDYRILQLPDFHEDRFPLLLALAQAPVVEERMAACRAARLRVRDVDLQGLGAHHLFTRSAQCREGELTLLLDIGAEETALTLQEGRALHYARVLSTGGARVTARIQGALGLLGAEAEEVKRTEGAIVPRSEVDDLDPRAETIHRVAAHEVSQLVTAVQGSLRYFQTQFALGEVRPARIVLTGGASRLEGLPEAIGAAFRCPAERLDVAACLPAANAAAEVALEEAGPSFAAALGMAQARMRDGAQFSFLPPRVRNRRDFWSRRVFVGYAAAAAVGILVLLHLSAARATDAAVARAEAWKKQITQARQQHERLTQARDRNRALAARVEALTVRELSGRDLAAALRWLDRATPPNVFYTELRTGGDFGVSADPMPTPRTIELSGYLVSPPARAGQPDPGGALDRATAVQRLREFADALQATDYFASVNIRSQPIFLAGSAEDAGRTEALREAYRVRLFGRGDPEPPQWGLQPGAAAVEFTIWCTPAEEAP
jgi:type IV pilus assembly protein PilM